MTRVPSLRSVGVPVPKLINGKYVIDPFDKLRHQKAVAAISATYNYTNLVARPGTGSQPATPPISGTPSPTKVNLTCCTVSGTGDPMRLPRKRRQVSTNSTDFLNSTRSCNGGNGSIFLGLQPGTSFM